MAAQDGATSDKQTNDLAWDEFARVDMRVGTIVAVEDFPEARRPAWKLQIDFGPEIGVCKSSAQITNYSREALLGRQVVAVVNFPRKQIGKFMSECLTLGLPGADGADGDGGAGGEVILVGPASKVPNGGRLF